MKKLRRAVDDYLSLRRALGFRLPRYEGVLHRFVSFLDGEQTDQITIERVARWANGQTGITARWRALQVGIVRGFARHWGARDPRTEVPPADLIPARRRRRAPYLYTQEEIDRLMDAAVRMPSRDVLWPATLSTLFGLLAVTGVRIGEALALTPDDVDLERRVLVVRCTKFRKSRLVPLRASTCRALSAYAGKRERQSPGGHKASTKYTLEVLGVELVGKVNPVGTMAAINLTQWLRKIADDDLFITVGRKNLDMLDAKVLAGCGDDEATCVKKIASALGADRLIYGIVNDFGGEFYVSLTMLDATTGKTTTWTGNSYATSRDTEYTAKVALDALIKRMP